MTVSAPVQAQRQLPQARELARELTARTTQRRLEQNVKTHRALEYQRQLRVANEIYQAHARAQHKLQEARIGSLLEGQA